jgi:predicted membrane protein
MEVERRANRSLSRLILGVGVITVGVLFMLDNLGLMDAGDVLQYWPVILIAIGLAKFGSALTAAGRLSAAIWMVAGGLLLFNTFHLLSFDPWDLWPLLIVFFGITMVMKATRGGRGSRGNLDPGDALNAFAVMAGVERKFTTQSFVGGDATAIMGGCEIDLRQASIGEHEAIIDVFTMWGGIEIRVPPDWTIKNEAFAFMGAVEDSRKEMSPDPGKQLVLKGFAIMGGIEVKN